MFLLQIWKYNVCILNTMIYIILRLLGNLNLIFENEQSEQLNQAHTNKQNLALC